MGAHRWLGDHRAQAKISMLDWMLRHRFEENQLDEEWFASLHHLLTLGENLDGVLAGLSRLPLEPAAQNTLKALMVTQNLCWLLSSCCSMRTVCHYSMRSFVSRGLLMDTPRVGRGRSECRLFQPRIAESVDFLESLQGLVRLDDKRRVFGLFAEAMSGETWQLHSTGEQWGAQKRSGDSSKTEVENDPRTVCCPSGSRSPRTMRNSGFTSTPYCSALVGNSLGLNGRSMKSKACCKLCDRQLALDLLILIEGHRVDWCWQHKLDGVRGWMPNTLMKWLSKFALGIARSFRP